MKVLRVLQDCGDYSASEFENSEYTVENVARLIEDGYESIVEDISSQLDCIFSLHHFGDVDPKFVEFVMDFIDRDQLKHSSFYIIK